VNNDVPGFEFMTGIVIGKILFGALFASRLFRNFALSSAALAILLLYWRHGVGGVLAVAYTVRADFVGRPEFLKGAALGTLLAFLVFGVYRRRVR
jgi:hypothetical protein